MTLYNSLDKSWSWSQQLMQPVVQQSGNCILPLIETKWRWFTQQIWWYSFPLYNSDKRDINIRQQEKTSSMVKTKLENKTLIKVKIIDSKNENKGDSPNDVTSRNNISAISIESLIDAHDVSYIDEEQEEVLSSIVAEPKKNSNAIHQNCQASFSDMDNQSLSYGTGSDQVRETQVMTIYIKKYVSGFFVII